MKPGLVLVLILITLFLLVWLGLQIKPGAYPPIAKQAETLNTMPLPAGLPAPVERFYRQTYGETLPVITSAIISGRGTMAPFGFKLPIRYRFIYDNEKNYRSRIEATFFTLPIMKINESVIDGHALAEMQPVGTDEGEWLDQGTNVRVWAEILTWFPAALLTDSRVHWKPVDENTALLAVPYGEKQERFVVRFDPESGKVLYFEAMKYRKANDRMLWINGIWFDQGKPWLHLDVEEMIFNLDVQGLIRMDE